MRDRRRNPKNNIVKRERITDEMIEFAMIISTTILGIIMLVVFIYNLIG